MQTTPTIGLHKHVARLFLQRFSGFVAGKMAKVISVLEQATEMLKSDTQGESFQSITTASDQPREVS